MSRSECCSVCGAVRPLRDLAPYYAGTGQERHYACESDECREEARRQIRGDVRAQRAA